MQFGRRRPGRRRLGRRSLGRGGWVRAVLALALLACPAAAPPPEPVASSAPERAEPPPEDFSGERAWRHLEALRSLGPRVPGSDAALRARAYLSDALREIDLEVSEQRTPLPAGAAAPVAETVNLLAAIPGASQDLVVVVAPTDSPPGSTGPASVAGASGAALVLELGRALRVRGSPYTVLLAFVEGDALAPASGSGAVPPASVGTGALLAGLANGEGLARVRLAVGFDRVAGPDLRIARDLLSSRTLREEFWSAARRLGDTDVFPPTAPFEATEWGERAFAVAGMRRFVAIVGLRPGPSSETPGPGSATPGPPDPAAPPPDAERAARERLGEVGAVSLDAITAISRRLEKIDRFVRSPLGSDAGAPAR